MNRKRQKNWFVALCLLPSILLFTTFVVIPTINIFRMSFYRWGGLSAVKQFVGWNNFKILMSDPKFLKAVQNSIFLIVVVTIVTMVFAVMYAAVLVRVKVKGQNFFRIVFYIPNILSVVVISSIFGAIYDPAMGLLNSLLGMFQPSTWEHIQFLGNQDIVIYSIAFAMIWQAVGYYMVMYMASMSSIPEHLYEAATLEGCGEIRKFFYITLPLIWDNIRTTLTFFIISTINLSFLFTKVMTLGGPDGASEVFLGYMYKQAYNNASYGYGMAIGVVVFLFSFVLSLIVNRVTKREPLQY